MSIPPPSPKQARIIWFALTALAVAVAVLLLGMVFWGAGWIMHRLSAVLLPVAVALVLAYILDPVVEFFVRKKVPRIWAIVLVFVLGMLALGAVVGSVVPGIIDESKRLVEELPKNTETLRNRMRSFLDNNAVGRLFPANWHLPPPSAPAANTTNRAGSAARSGGPATNTNAVELNLTIKLTDQGAPTNSGQTNGVEVSAGTAAIKKALDAPFSDAVMPGVTRALLFILKWLTAQLSNVTTWVEFLIGFVLVPVYLFYFLLEKKGINRSWPDYLPIHESKTKDEVVFVLRAINDCLIVFFRGQVLVALCVGTLLTVAYLILGLNYAVLLGVVAGVLGIVPYLGTIVSFALAITVAAIQFGDWPHPLCVLGIAAGVKLLEDFIISPKIIGDRSGLHPLTVILAVMIGANLLGGFLGALLAIPLTAALRTLMFRYVWKRRPAGGHAKEAGA